MNNNKLRKATGHARTEEQQMMFWLASIFVLVCMCGAAAAIHGVWLLVSAGLKGVI